MSSDTTGSEGYAMETWRPTNAGDEVIPARCESADGKVSGASGGGRLHRTQPEEITTLMCIYPGR